MTLRMTNGGWRHGAAWLVCCCSLFVLPFPSFTQNLVPNPSFEENPDCPVTIGFQGFSKPLHWESWNESPDYFTVCAGSLGGVDTLIRVPLNGFGFQYPLHGDTYVGMAAYDGWGDFREYVGCELLEPLEVGETYDLSFFTNVAFGGTYWSPSWACNNMGMLFTMDPNIWTDLIGSPFALRNYAHLHSPTIISDTAAWTLVGGSFVADSAYRYLVLGNFFSDALTDTLHLEPGPSLSPYYFVDGVCVTKAGRPCEFLTVITELPEGGVHAWPNPASDQLWVDAGVGTTWKVYDAIGRTLGTGVSAQNLLTLSVGQWAPGEYVLRLQGRENRYVRFVVMR